MSTFGPWFRQSMQYGEQEALFEWIDRTAAARGLPKLFSPLSMLGCGSAGCVFESTDDRTVIKITGDTSEIANIQLIALSTAPPSGFTHYLKLERVPDDFGISGDDAHVVWREAVAPCDDSDLEPLSLALLDQYFALAERCAGQWHALKTVGSYDRALKASFTRFRGKRVELASFGDSSRMSFTVDGKPWSFKSSYADMFAIVWLALYRIVRRMEKRPQLAAVGEAIRWALDQGLVLQDVRIANLGWATRGGKDVLVIHDPGYSHIRPDMAKATKGRAKNPRPPQPMPRVPALAKKERSMRKKNPVTPREADFDWQVDDLPIHPAPTQGKHHTYAVVAIEPERPLSGKIALLVTEDDKRFYWYLPKRRDGVLHLTDPSTPDPQYFANDRDPGYLRTIAEAELKHLKWGSHAVVVPIKVDFSPRRNPHTSPPMTPSKAKELGARLGVRWDKVKFTPKQLARGIRVELEHTDVTGGDLATTARIALAHLMKERPDYYERLMTCVERQPNPVSPQRTSRKAFLAKLAASVVRKIPIENPPSDEGLDVLERVDALGDGLNAAHVSLGDLDECETLELLSDIGVEDGDLMNAMDNLTGWTE